MRRPQPDPPRLRNWKCGQAVHVYQRASQRQSLFLQPCHMLLYLNRLDLLARRYHVRVHAFSLTSNHVHLLLEPLRNRAISHLMQHLQSYHSRFMNGLHHTHGHLWRNHFHAKPILTSQDYRDTLILIEQDPVSDFQHAHLYPYSSAPAHAANSSTYTLIHKKQSATISLHLDRWRREFSIPANGRSLWHSWLPQPRSALFLHRVAALIGYPPPTPNPLPWPEPAASARGS